MAQNGEELGLLPPAAERTLSGKILGMAVLVIVVVAGAVTLATLHRTHSTPGAERAVDAYAPLLPLTDITLSEATSGTGGKTTYVDGTVQNAGTKTVVSATVQVTFLSTDGSAPQRQSLPLALVRSREPYVDLQPIAAAPIHPGEERPFRLIFDTVPQNWDVKVPRVQVVHTTLQ